MYHRYTAAALLITAALLLGGCSASPNETETSDVPEETLEYNGITKKVSELSEDTREWLEWYHTLPEDVQNALSFVPSEFTSGSSAVTMETDSSAPGYLEALSEDELAQTAELARYYFTELAPAYGGVEQIQPADDSSPLYQNAGIEAEYTPGNIIIYLVETVKDKNEGSPMRTVSIARKSKSDDWKVINSGH